MQNEAMSGCKPLRISLVKEPVGQPVNLSVCRSWWPSDAMEKLPKAGPEALARNDPKLVLFLARQSKTHVPNFSVP